MSGRTGIRFVARHLLSNGARTFHPNPRSDYRGRLLGNMLAIRDLLRGSCHPLRVLNLS
jgi:hypothetical protein